MFSKVKSAVLVSFVVLPMLANATAIPRSVEGQPSGQCNTGTQQCCNSVGSADNLLGSVGAGLLGLIVGPITGLIGLNCSPINVIGGLGGGTCSAQTACCSSTSNLGGLAGLGGLGGLIGIGCIPINL